MLHLLFKKAVFKSLLLNVEKAILHISKYQISMIKRMKKALIVPEIEVQKDKASEKSEEISLKPEFKGAL